jgi:GNAT superfamily N-acetyltransferase
VRVEEVPPEATHDLRWRVLRNRRPGAPVAFPEDALPGTFHLAVCDDDAIRAVASFNPEPTACRPGRSAVRLRGMAVDPGFQRRGLGRTLIAAGIERLRRDGVDVLWCNARDTAAGFYARLGFETFGEGFVPPESGVPHHVMVRDV